MPDSASSQSQLKRLRVKPEKETYTQSLSENLAIFDNHGPLRNCSVQSSTFSADQVGITITFIFKAMLSLLPNYITQHLYLRYKTERKGNE